MDHPRAETPEPPRDDLAATDERGLMGRTAGYLYLLSALVLLGGLAMPGTERGHIEIVIGLALYLLAYGALSITDVIPWSRAPMWHHEVAGLVLMPVCGVALWATGGANSYALSLLVLPLFFLSYFYPRRWAWGLVTLLVITCSTPLFYDSAAQEVGYPARLLSVGVACFALTGVVVWLKEQLVRAELRQRSMALTDSLTQLGNRRAFDAALQSEVVRTGEIAGNRDAAPSALVFVDLDRFKDVNDYHGHPAGDRVLRAVAERCAGVVRPGDTVARIGGDEFAVVAPRAGREGAERMAQALEVAVADVAPAPGAEPIGVTVSFALLGEDGRNAAELLRAADRRLHDAKRARGGEPAALGRRSLAS